MQTDKLYEPANNIYVADIMQTDKLYELANNIITSKFYFILCKTDD